MFSALASQMKVAVTEMKTGDFFLTLLNFILVMCSDGAGATFHRKKSFGRSDSGFHCIMATH